MAENALICSKCGRKKWRNIRNRFVDGKFVCSICFYIKQRIYFKSIDMARKIIGKRNYVDANGSPVNADTLMAWFRNDCMSFAQIANQLNISKERVRQIRQEFSLILPFRVRGHQRTKVCTIKTRAFLKRKKEEDKVNDIKSRSVIKWLIDEIKKTGFKIGHLKSSHGKITIQINEWVCAIKTANPSSGYYKFCEYTKRIVDDYWLCITISESVYSLYIFPIRHILDTREYFSFNVPLDGYSDYHSKPKIKVNVYQYLNAWHLLTPKQKPASADNSEAVSPSI